MQIQSYQLFNSILIAASGSVYSAPISVHAMEGFCGLFIQSNYSSTSGNVSVIYELSVDNVNWSQEATRSTLLVDFTKTSGPASDGKLYISFSIPVAQWLRIKITETGAANPVQITAVLGIT